MQPFSIRKDFLIVLSQIFTGLAVAYDCVGHDQLPCLFDGVEWALGGMGVLRMDIQVGLGWVDPGLQLVLVMVGAR